MQRSQAALSRESSAHFTAGYLSTAGTGEEAAGDVAKNYGSESITEGSAQFTSEVQEKNFYVKGNESGLNELVGLSAEQSAADAGKWLISSTDESSISQLASSDLLSSVSTNTDLVGNLVEHKPAMVDGQEATGITGDIQEPGAGGIEAKATVFVSDASPFLPVAVVAAVKTNSTESEITIQFSNWDETVNLPAISGVTPLIQT